MYDLHKQNVKLKVALDQCLHIAKRSLHNITSLHSSRSV